MEDKLNNIENRQMNILRIDMEAQLLTAMRQEVKIREINQGIIIIFFKISLK